MAFENTPNKSLIRLKWDFPLLQRWASEVDHTLAYLGMPGPQLHDLRDWRSILSFCSCVETPGHSKRERADADETIGTLNTNRHRYGLSTMTELLVADVEDLIIDGTDSFGKKPSRADGLPVHRMHFRYDIVNLDFDGGLGYTDRHGAAKRIAAIKKLFERQMGHSFLFLLTVNVRDTLAEEIETYLTGMKTLGYGDEWSALLSWYIARGEGEREYKLKATVPSFIHSLAAPNMFRCLCRPPLVYVGYKNARMVHFVFELRSSPGNLRAWSEQNDRHLLDLPLLCVDYPVIRGADIQHEGLALDRCAHYLDFLPPGMRDGILASLPRALRH